MSEQTPNARISIQSRQEYENAPPDSVELITTGALRRTDDGYCVSYQESVLTGMEGTQTSLDITPQRVVLTRTGEMNTQMVFETGVRHLSLYSTPMGNLEVGVATRRLRTDMDEDGGRLEVDYSIDIDHQLAGENYFSLTVRRTNITQ